MPAVLTEVHGRAALVIIDHPPVNALSDAIREAIRDAVRQAADNPALDAILITGRGGHFAAGADITAFDAIESRAASIARSERIHRLLRDIEDSPKPVVAALRGHVLGGGLELAMACHYRVAGRGAMLGQPEVTLGLIPGAGGTQRLPRLVDASLALQLCTQGKPMTAPAAYEAGLVDAIVDDDDVVAGAVAFVGEDAGPTPTRGRGVRGGASALAEAEAIIASSSTPGEQARGQAARAIVAALTQPFDEGSRVERALFAECVTSTESKALRHLFFAERAVAKPSSLTSVRALDIRSAGVVGAGTMGAGIAMCYANAGIPVCLMDVSEAALDRGFETIRAQYASSVAKGRLTAEQADATQSRITRAADYHDFAHVDIVVEAAYEALDLKREIFEALGRVTPAHCVLASNTSTLDIDVMAAAAGRAGHVVGHHFFSPAHVMKLLEIVRGRDTSDVVLATSLALARRLGKIGVVVGNCFSFVANRMLAYYMREAYLLLEEGATVSQIDRVLTAFGMPVGPFAMQDIAGIDVGAKIRQHLAALGKTRADGPQSTVPDRLYELGRYGQKTSAGWYRYEPGSRTPLVDPMVDEVAADAARARGVVRRSHVPDEEILERVWTAVINEGYRILGEGYASSAGDIDVIYCHGFGFPRYRGGPLFYASTEGLAHTLARVHALRDRFGDYWRPAPLLERLVADGDRTP